MALPDQLWLQNINFIAEDLSHSERSILLYLCDSLDTDNSIMSAKEMLKAKTVHREIGYLFLIALLFQLKRFDLLSKVFRTNREDLERALKHQQVLPKFRVLMTTISEDMGCEDVNNVKFLLSSTLSREKLEKAKTFLDIIIELEKLDLVSPDRVDFVEEFLRNIDRVDLAKKVTAYRMPVTAAAPEQRSPQQQWFRTPRLSPASCSSYHLQQIRQEQPPRIAERHTSVPVQVSQSYQSQFEQYKFNSNPRGVCVIIDCVGNDGDMLEKTFTALHFKVKSYKWLSVNEIHTVLHTISKQRENCDIDSFVCCIISRGAANHLLGTDSYGPGLELNVIRRLFTADSCPMLAGKPKLFFIQRYNAPESQLRDRMQHRDEDLETDGFESHHRSTGGTLIPTDADLFWSHCSIDERQLEQGHHHSIYLKALTDALHRGQNRKAKLLDIHTEVNGVIYQHNRRNPGENYHIELTHTLRKDLYFQ